MTTLNFPVYPSHGQKYPDPPVENEPQFEYDAGKQVWFRVPQSAVRQPTILVNESAPATTGLAAGTLWWNPNIATLFVLYEDEDSVQWVEVGT